MSKIFIPGTGWGGGGGGASGPVTVGDIDATGTPGAATFLRGDGTWANPGTSDPFKSQTISANATTMAVTGLDLNADKRYEISGCVTQNGAGSVNYYLRANGDATNLATIQTLTTDGYSFAFDMSVEFHKDKAGVLYGAIFLRSDTDRAQTPLYSVAAANLTSIEIVASVADSIAPNSYINCWKMVGVGAPGPQGEQGPAGEGAIPQSLIRCTGISAKGSTNTNILRLATVTETVGTGITVTDSAANGGYVSVTENGVYAVSISLYNTSGGLQNIFVKRNTTLENNVGATDADLIRLGSINNTNVEGPSLPVYLTTTDKLYFTTAFTPDNTYPLFNQLTVTRVS